MRDWVEQAEVDAGERNGLTSGERAVATRLRVALRGDRGRQALQRLPGPSRSFCARSSTLGARR